MFRPSSSNVQSLGHPPTSSSSSSSSFSPISSSPLTSSTSKASNNTIKPTRLPHHHEQQQHQNGNEHHLIVGSEDQGEFIPDHKDPDERELEDEGELDDEERQFLHENRDLRICDLHPNMFVIFVGIKPSMEFIPSDCVVIIRKVYILIMREVQNATPNTATAILAWKRFWLLPLILFTQSNGIGNARNHIKTSVKKIMAGDWNTFTIGSLAMRKKPVARKPSTDSGFKESRITKLINTGQVSRAYGVLKNDTKRTVVMDNKNKLDLRRLYPLRNKEHGIDPHTLSQIRDHRGTVRQEDFREVSLDNLSRTIHGRSKGIAPGLNGCRFEYIQYIQNMWGFTDHPDQIEFRTLYTYIINKIMYAEIPGVLFPLWADTATSVLLKPNGKMRPLGKTNVERKLAASSLLNLNKAAIDAAFDTYQFGLKKLGSESILHMFQILSEASPDLDRFFPDGINAFNNVSREFAMVGITKYCPELLPFFLLNYGSSSRTWALDVRNDIFSIDMHEGTQQGCTLGSLLYGLATLPLVETLQDMITVRGKAAFFCDDGNIAAPHENMLACMKYLRDKGPKYGYIMHMNEGTCLLGKCGSMRLALNRRQNVIELGFHPTMVKIHPDDMLDNDLQEDDDIDEDLVQCELAMPMEQRLLEYGANVLGIFFGTDEYIEHSLLLKLEKIRKEAKILSEHPNAQQAFLFLRLCFSPKFDYILRTMPTHHTASAVDEISAMKRSILDTIINSEHGITDTQWEQSQMSLKKGGTGLRFTRVTRHAGSVASKLDVMPSLSYGGSDNIMDLDIPWVHSLKASIKLISDRVSTGETNVILTTDSIIALRNNHNDDSDGDNTLQSKLSNLVTDAYSFQHKKNLENCPPALAVYVSVSDPGGGAQSFLSAIPTSPTKTFTDSAFRILLHRYLMIPIPALDGSPIMCDCFKSIKNGIHNSIDPRGDHCLCCPRTGFGINNHNGALQVLQQIAQAAGKTAKREPLNVFAAARRDPATAASFNIKQLTSRPDLLIHNLSGRDPKVLLDVTITTPNPSGLTLAQARIPQRAAELRYIEKNNKYLAISKACKFGFHPIVFETTGRIHTSSLTFIRSLLKNISGGFRDGALLRRFWLEKLMCTVHQNIANSILDKINLQCGQRFIIGNYENRPDPNLEISLGRFM